MAVSMIKKEQFSSANYILKLNFNNTVMLSLMFPIFLISELITFQILNKTGFLSCGKTESSAFPKLLNYRN